MRWTCCLCTVGQVVHTLPEGEPVVGVTSLGDAIFVLRWKTKDQVELYDIVTYKLLSRMTVPNAHGFADMTSCEYYQCAYIADHKIMCVHRLDVGGRVTRVSQWPVEDKPRSLVVNAAHSVLVTCDVVRKIKEFSSHGKLIRQISLCCEVINPMHAIELTTGQFVVCHGNHGDSVNRVCLLDTDGRSIIHSHGGQPGSDTDQYHGPVRLALDYYGFVFVADINNQRVTLLSPTLNYMRQVVANNQLKGDPLRLCVDIHRHRLYVADNEWKDDRHTAGRVVVFSV